MTAVTCQNARETLRQCSRYHVAMRLTLAPLFLATAPLAQGFLDPAAELVRTADANLDGDVAAPPSKSVMVRVLAAGLLALPSLRHQLEIPLESARGHLPVLERIAGQAQVVPCLRKPRDPRASPEVSNDDEEQQMLVDGIVHLDDLAEEDKFFLIQQIEDLNKNIRYTCKQEDIFQDDQEASGDDSYNGRRAKRYNRSSLRNRTRKLDVILDEEEEYADDAGSENRDGTNDPVSAAEQ